MKFAHLICISLVILFTASFGALIGWYLVYDSTLIAEVIGKKQRFTNTSSVPFWTESGELPPIHMNFYFFNWTNPEELNMPGAKPNLVEVGPYSFIFMIENKDVNFHPMNSTVSYSQKYLWFFDKNRSNGTIHDKITQLDAIAVSATHRARYLPNEVQNLFYTVGLESNFSIIKTVNELLFSGYKDKLIELQELADVDKLFPFDRFSWFYERNGSFNLNGHFNMDTGIKYISDLGLLKKWNYKTTTPYFKNPCNLIEGSAGKLWPPKQTRNDIKLFIPDLCRSLTYEFNKETVYMGIDGYQYILSEKTLGKIKDTDNRITYLEKTTEKIEDDDIMNSCYCNGDCYPNGLINITACRNGSPVFVSLPHFYKADSILSNQVIGMNPKEKDHTFYIILEPRTGVPLEFAARLQINMLLPLSQNVSFPPDAPQIYFPIFWFSMKVQTSHKIALYLNSLLLIPDEYKTVGSWLITCSTLVIISNVGYIFYFFLRRMRRDLRIDADIPMVEMNGNAVQY